MTAARLIGRFRKAWAALAAGVGVVLTAGLITGSAAVWIATSITAGTAALNVLRAGPNDDPPDR